MLQNYYHLCILLSCTVWDLTVISRWPVVSNKMARYFIPSLYLTHVIYYCKASYAHVSFDIIFYDTYSGLDNAIESAHALAHRHPHPMQTSSKDNSQLIHRASCRLKLRKLKKKSPQVHKAWLKACMMQALAKLLSCALVTWASSLSVSSAAAWRDDALLLQCHQLTHNISVNRSGSKLSSQLLHIVSWWTVYSWEHGTVYIHAHITHTHHTHSQLHARTHVPS